MGESQHDLFRITVGTEAETGRIAAAVGRALASGDCVLLQGDLGAGKTAFARALIRSLAGDPDLIVPSPTFTLSQSYDLPHFVMTHFDLYRLGEAEEVFDLGWDDACADGVTLVEWPDRLGPFRPREALEIRLEATGAGEEERQLYGVGGPTWAPRLGPIFS